MNRCVDRTELERFLEGKLGPERMLAVECHLAECSICRSEAAAAPAFKRTAAGLGAVLIGAAECPDYETLSAFVEKTLVESEGKEVAAHINSCELCAADVARIEELRSQAALRETVTVRPGMSNRRATGALDIWKRALAGVAAAAAVAAVAISLTGPDRVPGDRVIATRERTMPPSVTRPEPQPAPDAGPSQVDSAPKPDTVAVAPDAPKPDAPAADTKPEPVRTASRQIMRDGEYRLFETSDKLSLARADGSSIRTPLEARVMAAIEEKIRTGKIKPAEPVRVAMNTELRDSGYTPPSTAPKPESPRGDVLLTNRPTLKWSEVDLAESYRVVVTRGDGSVVCEHITNKNNITLPDGLERGHEYRWQVGVRFSESDSWANSRAATFAVVSEEGYSLIQNAKSALPGSHLALGAAYESAGLYDEAKAEYRALVKQNPHSSLAKQLLHKTQGGER